MKRNEATWKQTLEACQKVGKDKVLAVFEAEHKVYENWHATACAESNFSLAHRLSLICLKQDETMIRLRNMTDEDIENALYPV